MTVHKLSQELTQEELIAWAAYFEIKNEEYQYVRDTESVSHRVPRGL